MGLKTIESTRVTAKSAEKMSTQSSDEETWVHTIRFYERKLRHISAGVRVQNSFFPSFDVPFKVKIGEDIVEMVINVYGRMKPRFEVWSHIPLLDQLKAGDTVVFTKERDGTYDLKKTGATLNKKEEPIRNIYD